VDGLHRKVERYARLPVGLRCVNLMAVGLYVKDSPRGLLKRLNPQCTGKGSMNADLVECQLRFFTGGGFLPSGRNPVSSYCRSRMR